MPSTVIEVANDICEKLKIKVKSVNSKNEIINAKNFSATFMPSKKIIEIKSKNY